MRRLTSISLIIIMTILMLFTYTTLSPAKDITEGVLLNLNGQRVTTDVPPIILNDITFVPVRAIFEKLGATVTWVDNGNEVKIAYKDKSINFFINNTVASINGVAKIMQEAPFIRNGRTLVPIRFMAENLGMIVGCYGPDPLVTVVDPTYFSNLGDKTVLGFSTDDYTGDNFSFDSIKAHYNNLNSIATFSYLITSDGTLTLTGKSQQATVEFVNSTKIRPLVLIHNLFNGTFDSALAHTILSDSNKRKSIIDSLLKIMADDQYSGVNIDIENVALNDRNNYSTFIKEVKETLSSFGYLTTVSLPAKTTDISQNKWSDAYDYSSIGNYADQILLMTYDEHYISGPSGPIASAPWVEKVLNYATSQIPSKKILLGIAGYGYDWSNSGNKVVTFNGVENVIAKNIVQPLWDDVSKSPYYKYTTNGVQHTVWYENEQSISIKLDLIKKYNLGGIGIWKLGYENDNFWSVVNAKLG